MLRQLSLSPKATIQNAKDAVALAEKLFKQKDSLLKMAQLEETRHRLQRRNMAVNSNPSYYTLRYFYFLGATCREVDCLLLILPKRLQQALYKQQEQQNPLYTPRHYSKFRYPGQNVNIVPEEYHGLPKYHETMVRMFRSNDGDPKKPPNLQLSHHLRMI